MSEKVLARLFSLSFFSLEKLHVSVRKKNGIQFLFFNEKRHNLMRNVIVHNKFRVDVIISFNLNVFFLVKKAFLQP